MTSKLVDIHHFIRIQLGRMKSINLLDASSPTSCLKIEVWCNIIVFLLTLWSQVRQTVEPTEIGKGSCLEPSKQQHCHGLPSNEHHFICKHLSYSMPHYFGNDPIFTSFFPVTFPFPPPSPIHHLSFSMLSLLFYLPSFLPPSSHHGPLQICCFSIDPNTTILPQLHIPNSPLMQIPMLLT